MNVNGEEKRNIVLTISCKLILHPFLISIEAISTWPSRDEYMKAVVPCYWNINIKKVNGI